MALLAGSMAPSKAFQQRRVHDVRQQTPRCRAGGAGKANGRCQRFRARPPGFPISGGIASSHVCGWEAGRRGRRGAGHKRAADRLLSRGLVQVRALRRPFAEKRRLTGRWLSRRHGWAPGRRLGCNNDARGQPTPRGVAPAGWAAAVARREGHVAASERACVRMRIHHRRRCSCAARAQWACERVAGGQRKTAALGKAGGGAWRLLDAATPGAGDESGRAGAWIDGGRCTSTAGPRSDF